MILALVVTAALPLLTAMWLANEIVGRISQTAFQPEFGQQLERSLGLYKDLVASMKQSMRNEGSAIANRHSLQTAVGEPSRLPAELDAIMASHETLYSIRIDDEGGETLANKERPTPMDRATYRPFTVPAELGDHATMTMVFAADRSRMDEMEGAQEFTQAYLRLESESRGQYVDRPYLRVFAVLFGLTVLLAVITGVLVVRPVTRRINRLAAATQPVSMGDLSVRVEPGGRDEIAELSRAFNQMLEQLDHSRARIEFLKRVGQWQNMARRLAHEIKNPLTPIQLAVEECHRRYTGDDARYKKLLQTTLDIVFEEVASLRRLVGEFAEFARMPRASLRPGDLAAFLREQRPRLEREDAVETADGVRLAFDIAEEEMPLALDRTMLYRVISNLVSNAAQAIGSDGVVHVRAWRDRDHCCIDVDDDGPGILPNVAASIFDPYMTTKKDGSGLGLTIVKKVVIDHGGSIDVDASPLGGARFRLRLPCLGTRASEAALSQSEWAPLSG